LLSLRMRQACLHVTVITERQNETLERFKRNPELV